MTECWTDGRTTVATRRFRNWCARAPATGASQFTLTAFPMADLEMQRIGALLYHDCLGYKLHVNRNVGDIFLGILEAPSPQQQFFNFIRERETWRQAIYFHASHLRWGL